jgi:hypothetical protein
MAILNGMNQKTHGSERVTDTELTPRALHVNQRLLPDPRNNVSTKAPATLGPGNKFVVFRAGEAYHSPESKRNLK